MVQPISNLFTCSQKSRTTFSHKRENDKNGNANYTYTLYMSYDSYTYGYCSANRDARNKGSTKMDDKYIYYAYTSFSLFSTLLGHQKLMMVFLEEGRMIRTHLENI